MSNGFFTFLDEDDRPIVAAVQEEQAECGTFEGFRFIGESIARLLRPFEHFIEPNPAWQDIVKARIDAMPQFGGLVRQDGHHGLAEVPNLIGGGGLAKRSGGYLTPLPEMLEMLKSILEQPTKPYLVSNGDNQDVWAHPLTFKSEFSSEYRDDEEDEDEA